MKDYNAGVTIACAWGGTVGGMAMISYRLYRLQDDRVSSTASFDAADDVAAIEAARAEDNAVDCELWSGTRLVAFIPAMPRPAGN